MPGDLWWSAAFFIGGVRQGQSVLGTLDAVLPRGSGAPGGRFCTVLFGLIERALIGEGASRMPRLARLDAQAIAERLARLLSELADGVFDDTAALVFPVPR